VCRRWACAAAGPPQASPRDSAWMLLRAAAVNAGERVRGQGTAPRARTALYPHYALTFLGHIIGGMRERETNQLI
jgi:hypothetical protein